MLEIRGTALNYIAYLSDYSGEGSKSPTFVLGTAGQTIHAASTPGAQRHLLKSVTCPRFDPDTHSERIAILGVQDMGQVALVPADTCKDDIVVAVAPHLPLILLHPRQGDPVAVGLYPANDAYENDPLCTNYFSFEDDLDEDFFEFFLVYTFAAVFFSLDDLFALLRVPQHRLSSSA